MILVATGSGLGSQLFHYAFARYVSLKTSKPVFMFGPGDAYIYLGLFKAAVKFILLGDKGPLQEFKRPKCFRYFALDKFAIPLKIMPAWRYELFIQGCKLTRIFRPSSSLHIVHENYLVSPDTQVLDGKKNVIYYSGQCWGAAVVNHVRASLVEDLQFISLPSRKRQELAAKIKNMPNAVALHIRAGWGAGGSDLSDKGERVYTGLHTRSLSADYYAKAVPLAESKLTKPTFFVFTDNLEKARALLAGLPQRSAFVYVDPAGHMPWEDLYLMQHCAHFILSNSTFAWWGAWLAHARNPQNAPLIIMPATWYRGTETWFSRLLQIGDNTIRIPNTTWQEA